uniref:Uncharacterized protein n=1 Tax=Arion vulgaris TaxID=1028688 RepID=A0A0B7BH25_9EUPU
MSFCTSEQTTIDSVTCQCDAVTCIQNSLFKIQSWGQAPQIAEHILQDCP